MNMLFEFFPLLLFLGTLLLKDIYAAVVVLMVSMPIGLADQVHSQRHDRQDVHVVDGLRPVVWRVDPLLSQPLLHLLEANGILLGRRCRFLG